MSDPRTDNPLYYSNKEFNNPSKEIWASSGIYDRKSNSPLQYAVDIPNSIISNTGINLTTPNPNIVIFTDTALFLSPPFVLSSGNPVFDNIDVFNPYRHHSIPTLVFNPEIFLKSTVNFFDSYSIKYRIW